MFTAPPSLFASCSATAIDFPIHRTCSHVDESPRFQKRSKSHLGAVEGRRRQTCMQYIAQDHRIYTETHTHTHTHGYCIAYCVRCAMERTMSARICICLHCNNNIVHQINAFLVFASAVPPFEVQFRHASDRMLSFGPRHSFTSFRKHACIDLEIELCAL